MSGVNKSITDLIGNTPLLELTNYNDIRNLEATIIAKLEYYNPSSSVKDRIAYAMIEEAERSGKLKPGDTIVEATSGNTGISLAAIAAAKGYKLKIYIQDDVSEERKKATRAHGAELINFSEEPAIAKFLEDTPDIIGAMKEIEKLVEKIPNAFFVNQTFNQINPETHKKTTGPEIWRDTKGTVDIIVSTVGTGGTVTGVGEYLKSQNPNIKVVAVEPGPNSVPIPGEDPPKEITGVHKFTEIDEAFVPPVLNKKIYDEVIPVETSQAYEAARTVARTDGILVGTSSGAAIYAATELAKRPENKGKNIVVILPDTGLRYLSTDLFEDELVESLQLI